MTKKRVARQYFGHDRHFWANWSIIFMGAQKTIIYRLVIRSLRYGPCFTFFLPLTLYLFAGRENRRGHQTRP